LIDTGAPSSVDGRGPNIPLALPSPVLAVLLMVSLATALAPVSVQAAPKDAARSFIQITGGSAAQLPLALTEPRELGPVDGDVKQTLQTVVRDDLLLSGYFKLLSSDAFIEPVSAGIESGTFDFDHWRLSGAVGLVKSNYVVEGDNVAVEVRIYDVDAGLPMLARRISGTRSSLRRIAHRVANAVIEAFTGTPGMFDTRILAVVDYGTGKEVYTFDLDGHNRRSVSRNGSLNLSPAWSPNGHLISYTSYRDNNPDLWVTDLRTGRHSKISAHPGINAGAEWAPDGSELALTLSKDGDSEIYAISPEGSILRRLTRQWGIDVSPSYSPDGKQIAFTSSRNGTPQVFIMDRDGSNTRLLTHRGGHNVSPVFSPDGMRIAFAGRDEGRFDIFVINTDGTGLRRLTQNESDDEDPSWSPGGTHIVFSSARSGRGKQLYIMTSDGASQQRITDGTGSFSNPTWGSSRR